MTGVCIARLSIIGEAGFFLKTCLTVRHIFNKT